MIDGREYSVISTEEELRSIGRTLPLSGNYVLGNDITLTKEMTPLGSEDEPFTGRFEGGRICDPGSEGKRERR